MNQPWEKEISEDYWFYNDGDDGIDCHILRNTMGAWCGYVRVPKGHPWHDKNHDTIGADVHGGLTYSGDCLGEGLGFWVGFDCAHAGDLVPAMAEYTRTDSPNGVYRDLDYVKKETNYLAKQAFEASGQKPKSSVKTQPRLDIDMGVFNGVKKELVEAIESRHVLEMVEDAMRDLDPDFDAEMMASLADSLEDWGKDIADKMRTLAAVKS